MARTWLSIRVDLVEGHGEHLWPRPGRIFAAARSHTFAQLARAIDDATREGVMRTDVLVWARWFNPTLFRYDRHANAALDARLRATSSG